MVAPDDVVQCVAQLIRHLSNTTAMANSVTVNRKCRARQKTNACSGSANTCALSEPCQQILQAKYKLPNTLVKVNSELGNQGICNGKLRNGKSSDSKLADADNPQTELGQGKNTASELANRDHAPGRHRDPVRSELEGNMQQRPP